MISHQKLSVLSVDNLQFPDFFLLHFYIYLHIIYIYILLLFYYVFVVYLHIFPKLCPELENTLLFNKKAKEEEALNHPEPSGIGLDSLAPDFWTRIQKGAIVLIPGKHNAFLAFDLTRLILVSDFYFGRWVAVRAHSCFTGAGYPEAVDKPLGEIFGIVAAVSDVRSKSRPLPIFTEERQKRD